MIVTAEILCKTSLKSRNSYSQYKHWKPASVTLTELNLIHFPGYLVCYLSMCKEVYRINTFQLLCIWNSNILCNYLISGCSFLYLLLNGACKAVCPKGYFEDLDQGVCVSCHPTCGTCSGPLSDDCETCSSLTPKLYEGTCLEVCPAGTYYQSSDKECQGNVLAGM